MTFEDSMHRVTLSGNEISSILYIMEGYINPSDDYSYDPVSYTHLRAHET